MLAQLRAALVVLGMLTVLTGVAYPLFVTGVAQAAFREKASGSLVVQNGKNVGSRLIGQPFDDPKYLWSRPSATSPMPYNGASSSGSNLGPTNPALTDAVAARVAALHAADPENTAPIPVDLVTTSASGLDPHISPAAAIYQVHRVAKARSLDEARVRSIIESSTEGLDLGFFGEPVVNVLRVNLALDALSTPKLETP